MPPKTYSLSIVDLNKKEYILDTENFTIYDVVNLLDATLQGWHDCFVEQNVIHKHYTIFDMDRYLRISTSYTYLKIIGIRVDDRADFDRGYFKIIKNHLRKRLKVMGTVKNGVIVSRERDLSIIIREQNDTTDIKQIRYVTSKGLLQYANTVIDKIIPTV